MSLFENDRYHWRETYFVLFPAKNRPNVDKVRQALSTVAEQLELTNLTCDDNGYFESLSILAPDDFAAIDISFLTGAEVLEQAKELAEEITGAVCCEPNEQARIKRLRTFDGRFDVLHFEEIVELQDQDEPDSMLNPSALLLVLEALAQLTDGIAIDPQGGTLL